MDKLAVVYTTGDVYIVGVEDVKEMKMHNCFTTGGYKFAGYAADQKEAEKIAKRYGAL